MFYELLCLRHPLARKRTLAAMLLAITSEPIPLAAGVRSPHQPAFGMDLSWFLQKGLAKDPAERFQSATEMLARLARRAEGDVPVQCPVTLVLRLNGMCNRFVSRHPIVVTLGVAAMTVLLLATALLAAARHAG